MISDFVIALAAGDLADVSPRRSGIGGVRIVHPFGKFVAESGSISSSGKEGLLPALEFSVAVGLPPNDVVIAQNAAGVQVRGGPAGHDAIVEKEEYEGVRCDAELGDQRLGSGIPEAKAHDADASGDIYVAGVAAALAGFGVDSSVGRAGAGAGDDDGLHWIGSETQKGVIVRAGRNVLPEVSALESVDVLGGADGCSSELKRGIVEQGRCLSQFVSGVAGTQAARIDRGGVEDNDAASAVLKFQADGNNDRRNVCDLAGFSGRIRAHNRAFVGLAIDWGDNAIAPGRDVGAGQSWRLRRIVVGARAHIKLVQ